MLNLIFAIYQTQTSEQNNLSRQPSGPQRLNQQVQHSSRQHCSSRSRGPSVKWGAYRLGGGRWAVEQLERRSPKIEAPSARLGATAVRRCCCRTERSQKNQSLPAPVAELRMTEEKTPQRCSGKAGKESEERTEREKLVLNWSLKNRRLKTRLGLHLDQICNWA